MNMTMNTTGHNHVHTNHSMSGTMTPITHGSHGHGGHGTSGHDMNMNGGHSMSHQMYFRFTSEAVILFKEWDIDSTRGMVWSCIVVFLMAVLYEGFKVFREVLRQRYSSSQSVSRSNGHTPGGKDAYDTSIYQGSNRFLNWYHILQSFLHVIQVALSYFLMLIAMTFNGYLFIFVCLGAGFGYFLFSWKVNKAFDLNEHCH